MNDLKAIRCNRFSVENDSELKLMSQVLLTVANPDIVGPKTWTLYCGEGQDALVRKLFASREASNSWNGSEPQHSETLYEDIGIENILNVVPAYHTSNKVVIDDDIVRAFLKGCEAASKDGRYCSPIQSIGALSTKENYNMSQYWSGLDSRLCLALINEYCLLNKKAHIVNDLIKNEALDIYIDGEEFSNIWMEYYSYDRDEDITKSAVHVSVLPRFFNVKRELYRKIRILDSNIPSPIIYNRHIFSEDTNALLKELKASKLGFNEHLDILLFHLGERGKNWKYFTDVYPITSKNAVDMALGYCDSFCVGEKTIWTSPYYKDEFLEKIAQMSVHHNPKVREVTNQILEWGYIWVDGDAVVNDNRVFFSNGIEAFDGFEGVKTNHEEKPAVSFTLDLRNDSIIQYNAEYHGLDIEWGDFKGDINAYLSYKKEKLMWNKRIRDAASFEAFYVQHQKKIESVFKDGRETFFFTHSQITELISLADKSDDNVVYFWPANEEKTIWKTGKSTVMSFRSRTKMVMSKLRRATGASYRSDMCIYVRSSLPFDMENDLRAVFKKLSLEEIFTELGSEKDPAKFDGYTEFIQADLKAIRGVARVIAASTGQGSPVEVSY